jgi:CheY-like chemotaxis protein
MPDKTLNTLLYIDDDAHLRSLVAMALETIGNYTVKLCASGAEALALLQHFTPDMILLDVIMPEMDGLETLQRIQELDACKNTPVIFMTGRSTPELISTFKQAGALDIIAKPFNPLQLPSHLQTLWNQYDQ